MLSLPNNYLWKKSEFRFYATSNPAGGILKICKSNYLWRWSWLSMRFNAVLSVKHFTEKIGVLGSVNFQGICTKITFRKSFYLWWWNLWKHLNCFIFFDHGWSFAKFPIKVLTFTYFISCFLCFKFNFNFTKFSHVCTNEATNFK